MRPLRIALADRKAPVQTAHQYALQRNAIASTSGRSGQIAFSTAPSGAAGGVVLYSQQRETLHRLLQIYAFWAWSIRDFGMRFFKHVIHDLADCPSVARDQHMRGQILSSNSISLSVLKP